MPELPEVEMFRQYIEKTSLWQTIIKMEIRNDIIVREVEQKILKEAVEGSEFTSVLRYGKWLYLQLSKGGWLIWHFGMTGRPISLNKSREERFTRALFLFRCGSLAFVDPRMLGHLDIVSSPDVHIKEKKLGPDALDISYEIFMNTFQNSRGNVKAALMNQHKVAGIGNLYSDEILFQCQVNPNDKACSLSNHELECIFHTMRRVLQQSIAVETNFDLLPNSYLLRNRSRKGVCPRCNTPLQTDTIGGRTSYFCAKCLQI